MQSNIAFEGEFSGSEGPVHYQVWMPDEPKAIVLVVHGYAEYGARYAHLAKHLVSQGMLVAAPDHIGHGKSGGERALIADFEHVVDDLHTLSQMLQADHPDIPLVLVGHSMGGLLSARFAQRHPENLAGVAFLGAVIGDWKWAREVLSYPELPEADSNPLGMSRDEAVCRDYASDPLVYHGLYKRPLLVAEVACLDRFNAEIDRITMAVGFFHGKADPFVPYEDSLDAVQRMPACSHAVHLYEGAKHELVNEINRDEVMADLTIFIKGAITTT